MKVELLKRLLNQLGTALKPKKAVVFRRKNNDDASKEKKGEEQVIDVDDVAIGDIVVTRPGERFATDGIVVYGESSVDE